MKTGRLYGCPVILLYTNIYFLKIKPKYLKITDKIKSLWYNTSI